MSPPSFPPAVPCHGIPFPPRGPLDRFPRFAGTTGMLGRPAIPRASLRFLRSALPPCARFFLLSRRRGAPRSEEHTSELQSRSDLVCRLLLEKKKKKK